MELAFEIIKYSHGQRVEALEGEIAKAKSELSAKIKVCASHGSIFIPNHNYVLDRDTLYLYHEHFHRPNRFFIPTSVPTPHTTTSSPFHPRDLPTSPHHLWLLQPPFLASFHYFSCQHSAPNPIISRPDPLSRPSSHDPLPCPPSSPRSAPFPRR